MNIVMAKREANREEDDDNKNDTQAKPSQHTPGKIYWPINWN
jgi:hypothetical protein